MLCAAIGSLLSTIPYLLQQCSRYNTYPGVASNGLRSSVSIFSTCTLVLDDIIKSLLTSSNTRRDFAQAVSALEEHSELLRDHAQLFKVIYAVVQVDKTGDLIVDHTQFPDDFLDTAESMERRSFYGRCLGLHSASSEPSKAVIIHFHGGGFLAQTSQSHVSYLSHWANQLNVPVASVDYMTAPEHPYPRAVNDCFYAYAWVLRNATSLGTTAEKVILAGDSAGGNFVFGVAFLAAQYQLRKPCLVLGAYPALKISLDLSPARCLSVMDPLLPIGTLRACLNAYRGSGSTPEYNPNTGHLSQLQSGIHHCHATILNASPAYLSPLLASDEMLHSLPSVALLPSSFNPLLDDSIVMARRLHALGKDVTLRPFDGISHGFLNFHAVSRLAQQATNVCIELMDAAIKQHDQDV
ncbi:hormone-sensitive lipase-like isoform X1 [Sycon ciliatum]|uniref:hormone-sensitive lipase-like isoform X1 n=1 Tax=Sycon ciliatum TaxID=27933 RepID=UPI0031F65CF5